MPSNPAPEGGFTYRVAERSPGSDQGSPGDVGVAGISGAVVVGPSRHIGNAPPGGGSYAHATGAVVPPSSSPTRNTRDQRHTVTVLRGERGTGLGCLLDKLIVTGVRDGSPSDRAGVKSFVGMRLTHVNGVAVESEAALLDLLTETEAEPYVQLHFANVVQDADWRSGVARHAASTPQLAYPPTYQHPPPEGRVDPYPPSSSPLLTGPVDYDLSHGPGPAALHTARARSEAVCARVGLRASMTYSAEGLRGPLTKTVGTHPSATSTYFAVDRSPEKFHAMHASASAPYRRRVYDDPDPQDYPGSEHDRRHNLGSYWVLGGTPSTRNTPGTTRGVGVGDPSLGLSNIVLPPTARHDDGLL